LHEIWYGHHISDWKLFDYSDIFAVVPTAQEQAGTSGHGLWTIHIYKETVHWELIIGRLITGEPFNWDDNSPGDCSPED